MAAPRFVLPLVLALGGCQLSSAGAAGTPSADLDRMRRWGQGRRGELVRQLADLASRQSVKANPEGLAEAAAALTAAFEDRGQSVEDLAVEGPPLLLVTGPRQRGKPTILFYAHYDGQAVNPDRWTRCSPFAPAWYGPADQGSHPMSELPEHPDDDLRLCGRAVADDKGPIAVFLQVLQGMKDLAIRRTAVTYKLLLDGEEESGSPHLGAALQRHRERLAADVVVSLDGPVHGSGGATVVFGVRGIASLDLTTYGAPVDLHSGHYGNWAPNPALELAQILASMKDPLTGQVKIEGYADCRAPLDPVSAKALAEVPSVEEATRERLALGHVEPRWSLAEAVTWPSLNVRGLAAGDVGAAARTVIPNRAEAAIDIRLVKGCTGDRMVQKVRSHLAGLGYHVVESEPTAQIRRAHPKLVRLSRRPGGYDAVRTPMDWDLARDLVAAVGRGAGEAPVRIPTMGGSLPFHLFERTLGTPLLGVPLVNHDNNQHGPNENVRVGHLARGFDVLAAILLTHGS